MEQKQKWRELFRLDGDGEGVLDKDVWSGGGLGEQERGGDR